MMARLYPSFPEAVQHALSNWQTADLTPVKQHFLQRTDILMSIQQDAELMCLACSLFTMREHGDLRYVGHLNVWDDGDYSYGWV